MRKPARNWISIECAPYNEPVEVKTGWRKFKAVLVPDISLTSEGVSCDQWHACEGEKHPPCWTDGACWESNADEQMSIVPTGWRPIKATRP